MQRIGTLVLLTPLSRVAFVTCGIFLSVGAHAEPAARIVAGEIVSVSGLVSARDDSNLAAPGKDHFLKTVGDPVFVGDAISTGNDGQIKLLMKDQSILDLGSASLVRIKEFSKPEAADRSVRIDLERGQMRGAVTKKLAQTSKFVIRTKTATMGVRGTELIVKADAQNRTELTVLQGRVAVEASGLALKPGESPRFPVYVSAGRQIIVTEVPQQTNIFTAPPAVISVAPQRLSEITQSVKVADTVLRGALTSEGRQNVLAVSSEATLLARAPASTNPTSPAALAGGSSGSFGAADTAPPSINPRAGTSPKLTVTVLRP